MSTAWRPEKAGVSPVALLWLIVINTALFLYFAGAYGTLRKVLPINGKRLVPLNKSGALLAP